MSPALEGRFLTTGPPGKSPCHYFKEKTISFNGYIFFLAMPCGMQDLSSLTRDRTCTPCSGSSGVPTTGPPGNSQWLHFFKSPIIEHLGYFLSFAIINETVVNIVVIKSLSTFLTSSL